MQITEAQFQADSLASFGAEAARLLRSGNYTVLADRFGYALAHGRDPADAIQEALASCLAELGASALLPSGNDLPKVSYFGPNDIVLAGLVEVFMQADNGKELLLELIVTGKESSRHVTLEQLSVAA
jgi:hypothetical protein